MSAAFTPLGLDHIVLRVRDVAAAVEFYTRRLGCTLERVNAAAGIHHLRFGAAFIDLVAGAGAGDAATQTGMDHFCLSIACADLAALADALRDAGVAVQGGIADRLGAYGRGASLYLRDPDGYLVELKPRPQ